MAALYSHTTRSTGTTLTALIYNADHQNHIDNGVPAQLDDYSTNASQMQSETSPGTSGSESLATSLAGELERLRYVLRQMNGGAYWYDTSGRGGIGKNAIINGDMEIAQRGTSFAAIANGAYSLDRWIYVKVGATVHTITQDTDVPTVAQAGRLFTHSLKLALTTPDTAIAAGDYCLLQHRIEGYNWRALAQRIITLSFWIKSPITGIHCASLRNAGVDRSCVKEFTVNVVNTWEKKTLTFPASPSAGTWDYTTGVGAYLSIALAAGSTFQGTANSWQSSDINSTANQVNGVNTGITPYFITGVQLEAGSVATEFEGRQFEQELALCQRYYWKTFKYETTPTQTAGVDTGDIDTAITVAGAALNHFTGIRHPVVMRATPTIVTYNVGAANAEARNVTDGADCSSTTPANITDKGIGRITYTGNAGGTINDLVSIHLTASAEL